MADEAGLDGRDEPAWERDDHAELLSVLDSHDLSLALDVVDASDADAFEFDPGADPDAVFPQSVASGGPTPTGVILWTRVDPEVYDAESPLAVQVASDEAFEDVVYDGVVNLEDVTDEYDADGA